MKVSIFSSFLLFCYASSDDPLPCRFSDGTFGKCVDIKNCKSLYGLFRQGTVRIKDLPICDSVKRLVCCPRISSKKCREYGKSAVEETSIQNGMNKVKCKFSPTLNDPDRYEASPLEFPHQALLGYQINEEVMWICGGSLISPEFVLTAGRCISSIEYGAVKFVKLGVLDRLYYESKSMIFTVKQTFKHSKGRISSLHNDIALLKLQGSVKIGENIWPICLPTRPYFDPRAIKTGFGETDKDMLSQHLLKDEVGRLDQQICTNFYGEYFNETTMMCYEHQTERRNICVTDEGGPLQVDNDEQINCTYTQIGISSFGQSTCGMLRTPSTYVNVFKFLDWIEGIVWKDEV